MSSKKINITYCNADEEGDQNGWLQITATPQRYVIIGTHIDSQDPRLGGGLLSICDWSSEFKNLDQESDASQIFAWSNHLIYKVLGYTIKLHYDEEKHANVGFIEGAREWSEVQEMLDKLLFISWSAYDV